MLEIVIGTGNAGKRREYQVLLAHLPVTLLDLAAVGLGDVEVEEPYDTYAANAIHKGRAYADLCGRPVLADDSGLEVDALEGRPGVYSARYATGGDRDRYMKLLGELEGVPDARRTARFKCISALVTPGDAEPPITALGVVEGRIAHAPTEGGTVGFGYDFVFIPRGYDVALSALDMDVKNQLSHRGNAIRALIPQLEDYVRRHRA
ncbi:MAG: non-canonical purine NTP pyrophosphatase [bacterium]|nr:non-canonical purine NTP pyrophosphatase [bacterium]